MLQPRIAKLTGRGLQSAHIELNQAISCYFSRIEPETRNYSAAMDTSAGSPARALPVDAAAARGPRVALRAHARGPRGVGALRGEAREPRAPDLRR